MENYTSPPKFTWDKLIYGKKNVKRNNGVFTSESAKEVIKTLNAEIKKIDDLEDQFISTNRNLIYYSIFDLDSFFLDLLFISLCSLFKKHIEKFDVLFITDVKTKSKVEQKLKNFNFCFDMDYMIVETPVDGVEASKNKMKVFNYNKIDNYETILFLDADIIAVNCIDFIFKENLEYNKLYTANLKHVKWEAHQQICHGLYEISKELLNVVIEKQQKAFNAGQFLFKNSLKMRLHFNNLNWLVDNWNGDYFFEQSFMNYYFCCAAQITESTKFNKFVYLLGSPWNKLDVKDVSLLIKSGICFIHFIGPTLKAESKKNRINEYYFYFRKIFI